MILTITLNPSMDYNYLASSFILGKNNRMENPHQSIGGKGINAGRVCAISGSEVILAGVLGGRNGQTILATLQEEQRYHLEFLMIDGNSRNAVTIMHDDHTHTEIVEKGIFVSAETEQRLHQHLARLLMEYPVRILCISGSVNAENSLFYADLLDFLRKLLPPKFPILLDISGEQLLNVLKKRGAKPTFIKPNIHELEEVLNKKCTTTESIVAALNDPLFQGIDTVMISRGEKGALVKQQQAFFQLKIPTIAIVNTTGCGDATIGGMAHAMSQGYATKGALAYAMACGMSNALFETNGQIDPLQVEHFLQNIHVIPYS